MKGFPSLAVAMLAGLILTSCNLNPDYASSNNAPVLLVVSSINGGHNLDADVLHGENATPPAGSTSPILFFCPEIVGVKVENQAKDPRVTLDFRSEIVITRYEVTYSRSDGRGVQGVDVPYSISGNIAAEILPGTNTTLGIEVVRRQAMDEPPLSQLILGSGGTGVLTVIAKITVHGQTPAGQTVTGSGFLQIDFADYGDKDTACPTPTITG
jgi:hypothetical protein